MEGEIQNISLNNNMKKSTVNVVHPDIPESIKLASASPELLQFFARLRDKEVPGVCFTLSPQGMVQIYFSHQFDRQDGLDAILGQAYVNLAENLLGLELAEHLLAYTEGTVTEYLQNKGVVPNDLDYDSLIKVYPDYTPEDRDNDSMELQKLFVQLGYRDGIVGFAAFGTRQYSQIVVSTSAKQFAGGYYTVLEGLLANNDLDDKNLCVFVGALENAWEEISRHAA